MSANIKKKAAIPLDCEHRPGDPPHRLTRTRRLTPEEAARDRQVREAVMEEFPPVPGSKAALLLRVRKFMAQLRAERERQGLTLSDLAKETGLDQASLAQVENGQLDRATFPAVLAYVKALGKDVELRLIDL